MTDVLSSAIIEAMQGIHPKSALTVALITAVFGGKGRHCELVRSLVEARGLGADVALLPELPLHTWIPARRGSRFEDAEGFGGPRQKALSRAAREAGIAVLGGAIVVDQATGKRHNRALLYDKQGGLHAYYDKIHIPCEEGYWEADHYEAGGGPLRTTELESFDVGIQICSDIMRPIACQVLGVHGVEVILVPRATADHTYQRWLTVMRANALTTAAWLVSVNRPNEEPGTDIGGPSVVVSPKGDVVLETLRTVCIVELKRSQITEARAAYPGYLDTYPEIYIEGLSKVAFR